MPNIIDITYFHNPNELNIPLSVTNLVANPTLETPNSNNSLSNLIVKVEKSILLNALGLTVYNELKLALADLSNPLYANYKKLVEGEEYDGKVWIGLDNEFSLIAYRIFELFLTETNEHQTSIGTTQGNPEKSTLISPRYKIASANQNFIENYQKGYLDCPIVTDNFIDWFGIQSDVNVSFYQYLRDKNFNLDYFRTYETKNSFGI
jgi:hypothetical protein